jgi:hypothetical protein
VIRGELDLPPCSALRGSWGTHSPRSSINTCRPARTSGIAARTSAIPLPRIMTS